MYACRATPPSIAGSSPFTKTMGQHSVIVSKFFARVENFRARPVGISPRRIPYILDFVSRFRLLPGNSCNRSCNKYRDPKFKNAIARPRFFPMILLGDHIPLASRSSNVQGEQTPYQSVPESSRHSEIDNVRCRCSDCELVLRLWCV